MSLVSIRPHDAYESPEWTELDRDFGVISIEDERENHRLLELISAIDYHSVNLAQSDIAGEIDWFDGVANRTLVLPKAPYATSAPIPHLIFFGRSPSHDSALDLLSTLEVERNDESMQHRSRIEELRRSIDASLRELTRSTSPESLSIGEIQRRLRDLEASKRTRIGEEWNRRIEAAERKLQSIRQKSQKTPAIEYRSLASPKTLHERDHVREIDAEIDRWKDELQRVQRRIAELRRDASTPDEYDSRDALRSADARAAAIENALRSIDRGEGCAHCEMLRLRDRLQLEAADLRRDLQRICASISRAEANVARREAETELREKLEWEKRLQELILAAQERKQRLSLNSTRSIAHLAGSYGPHGPGCHCPGDLGETIVDHSDRIRRLEAEEKAANEVLADLRRKRLRAEAEATPDFGNDDESIQWTRRLENAERRERLERSIADMQRELERLEAIQPRHSFAETVAGEIQQATRGRIRAMRRNAFRVWEFETKIGEFVAWERLDRSDRLFAALAIHATFDNADARSNRTTWVIDSSDLNEDRLRDAVDYLRRQSRPGRQFLAFARNAANEAILMNGGAKRAARRLRTHRAHTPQPAPVLRSEVRPAANFIRNAPVNRGWDCEEFPGELDDREGYQRRSAAGFLRTGRETRSVAEQSRLSNDHGFEVRPDTIALRAVTPPSFTEPSRSREFTPRLRDFAQPRETRSFERAERERAEAERGEQDRLEREHGQRERRPTRERSIEPRDFTSGSNPPKRERRERSDDTRGIAVAQLERFYLELDSPIVDAPSIGPKMAEKFEAIGIRNVREFLRTDAADLAARLDAKRIGEAVLLQWQRQTRFVVSIPELRGHDAQILTACDVQDAQDLARRDPQELSRTVAAFCDSNAGKRVIRDGRPPDAEEVAQWIAAAAKARKVEAA